MDWLNYHHLRYFWTTARAGSVSQAAKELRLTQPTVSEQIQALEDALGEPLFRRENKRLVLTEVGRTVLRFADDIFAIGGELLDTVKGRPTGRPLRLSVGIADVVPKLVAYRIVEPAIRMRERVRVVCHEDAPERLLDQLSEHTLDVVITDAPLGPSHPSRAHNHLLGECGVSVFGARRLAWKYRPNFPRSLDGAPFLMPTWNTALRRSLDEWFNARQIKPEVIGEFQDAALLSVFAQAGEGLFAGPDAIERETALASGFRRVGAMKPLSERYYAITVERRLKHPGVVAIAGEARPTLFRRSR